jgi:hypothetical protein
MPYPTIMRKIPLRATGIPIMSATAIHPVDARPGIGALPKMTMQSLTKTETCRMRSSGA